MINTKNISISINADMLVLLDTLRGPVSRSAFISWALYKYIESDEQRKRTINY